MLTLRVVGRRVDGYQRPRKAWWHSPIAPTALSLTPGSTLDLSTTGPLGARLRARPLTIWCSRAAQLLANACRICGSALSPSTGVLPGRSRNPAAVRAECRGGAAGWLAQANGHLARVERLRAWSTRPKADRRDEPVCLPRAPAFMTGVGETLLRSACRNCPV